MQLANCFVTIKFLKPNIHGPYKEKGLDGLYHKVGVFELDRQVILLRSWL